MNSDKNYLLGHGHGPGILQRLPARLFFFELLLPGLPARDLERAHLFIRDIVSVGPARRGLLGLLPLESDGELRIGEQDDQPPKNRKHKPRFPKKIRKKQTGTSYKKYGESKAPNFTNRLFFYKSRIGPVKPSRGWNRRAGVSTHLASCPGARRPSIYRTR